MAPSPKVKLSLRKPKSKVKKVSLSDEQKAQLAKLVEKHPELWMLSNPNYKQRDMHYKSWDVIAVEMGVTGKK